MDENVFKLFDPTVPLMRNNNMFLEETLIAVYETVKMCKTP